MAHDVFISYSSIDKKVADAVCSAFESVKIRCWIAPRDILVGEKWPEAISDAIDKSPIMVLIFSSNSNNSKDVSKELVLAMNAGVNVVPLRIEEVAPKGVMKYYLSDTHWIDALNPPTKKQIDDIVETISLLINKAKGTEGEQKVYKKEDDILPHEREKEIPGKKTELSKSNRLAIIIGTFIFAAIIAAVFIVIGINRKTDKTNIAASVESEEKTVKEEIAGQAQKTEPIVTGESTAETVKESINSEEKIIKNEVISSIVGNLDTPGGAYDVCVGGNYAYIADGNAGLQIIDITDKKNPSIIGTCKAPGRSFASGIYLEGNYVYTADGYAGFQIIDIKDKKNPYIAGSVTMGASGVYIEGNYAYIAGNNTGFHIIDITDKKNPFIIGSYDFSKNIIEKDGAKGSASDVHIKGNYAYVSVNSSIKGSQISERGLLILDITNKENPIMIGGCNTPNDAMAVYVDGEYAYMADISFGLVIMDITSKENPNIIGNCDFPGSGRDVYVKGNYAYMTSGEVGFSIIDITNKEKPVNIGSCVTPGDAWGIYIDGDYAYIADNEKGLQIIDTGIRQD